VPAAKSRTEPSGNVRETECDIMISYPVPPTNAGGMVVRMNR
jgi:hypothetical protein